MLGELFGDFRHIFPFSVVAWVCIFVVAEACFYIPDQQVHVNTFVSALQEQNMIFVRLLKTSFVRLTEKYRLLFACALISQTMVQQTLFLSFVTNDSGNGFPFLFFAIKNTKSCVSFADCLADLPVDVVFLLDTSGSVGEPNFVLMRDFVANVIRQVDMDSGIVRLGVATFSDDAQVVFYVRVILIKNRWF